MVEKIKKFNWLRIILPLSTYYKKKYGIKHPLLYVLDVILLCAPFGTLIIIALVKFALNDIQD